MVSWLRSFDLKWKNYNSQFGAGEAFAFQNRLIAVREEPDPVDAMAKLLSEASEYPGIFLIARGTQGRKSVVKPTYRVAPFHHPKVVLAEGDPRAIGLPSIHVTAPMGEVAIAQLTGPLVSEKKARSKNWREKLVPSLEKLVEENHSIDDPPTREDGMGGFAIQDLKDWPRIIFVPVHLLTLLYTKGEASDDESKIGEDIDEGDPSHLLSKLVSQMQSLMESNRAEYEEALAVGLHLAAFLWAIANKISEGVELSSVEGDRVSVEHGIACNQELLYDEKQWEVLSRGRQRENEWDASEDTDSEKELEESNLGHRERAKEGAPGVRGESEETVRATLPATQTTTASPPDWATAFLQQMAAASQTWADVGVSLQSVAKSSQINIGKRETKEKVTSNWLPSWTYLVRFLSADEGWSTEGLPNETEAFVQLTEMRLFAATQLVRSIAMQAKWPGGMLKSGVGEFLKLGFINNRVDTQPAAFSVLFFYGGSYEETDGKAFSKQQLREAYGDGELSEEMIRAFDKKEIFIPENTYHAEDQLATAISFLQWICGDQTLATSGYKRGLAILKEHKRSFEAVARSDKLFLFNYLYLFDRVFQRFLQKILQFEHESDPILAAREEGLESDMVRSVNRTLNS